VDPAADAEFGWMLEMWGYSIGAAVGGINHLLLESFQLEPSSQFGVRTTDGAGEYTHHILHYTFSHEYSLEGVPMIDSRSGAYAFDKRNYQAWLPRQLQVPPRCALESTHTLYNLLHDAMAAHDHGNCSGCTGLGKRWDEDVHPPAIDHLMRQSNHDTKVRYRIDFAASLDSSSSGADVERIQALRLVGTGPWVFNSMPSSSASAAAAAVDRPFFFLRGGQLHTPWGSAAWALSTEASNTSLTAGPLVVYLCGRERWTHSIQLQTRQGAKLGAGTSRDGLGWLRDVRLIMTARENGEVQLGTFDADSVVAAALAAAAPSPAADLLAAFVGKEDAMPGDADAAAIRRRFLGTGAWPFGRLGEYFLLAHGIAYSMNRGRVGSWWTEVVGGKPAIVLHGGGVKSTALFGGGEVFGGSKASEELRLAVDCWRLSSASPAFTADLVWRHPASRCFPTCSDQTHQLTAAEYSSSALAKRAGKYSWTWAGIQGMQFTFSAAEKLGVLVTPWGHGEWGITPSRSDVLLAEFAQQRHMLRFHDATATFTSTRCSDGEVVKGAAMGWEPGMDW